MVNIIITEHARFEAQRRGIDLELVRSIVEHPQQIIPAKKNRLVLQSKYHDKLEEKEMLLRVIIEPVENSQKVISVYRTSKMDKYWREEERHESGL
jgi:hypothetical protein